ncbi:MAG: hypothetical protein AAB526_02115, partial [Patescibacteria group bacterium]
FCWISFGIILLNVDPFEAEFGGFVLFYCSLFLSLMGTMALSGSLIRIKFKRNKVIPRQIIVSFRQAIWFSVLIIFFLILHKLKLLYWWNINLLICFLIASEFFFISFEKNNYKQIH